MRVNDPQAVFTQAKRAGMILGDWYWSVIVPDSTDPAVYGYHSGSCPVAEELASHVINLPTHPRLSVAQAHQIIDFIKPFVQSTASYGSNRSNH